MRSAANFFDLVNLICCETWIDTLSGQAFVGQRHIALSKTVCASSMRSDCAFYVRHRQFSGNFENGFISGFSEKPPDALQPVLSRLDGHQYRKTGHEFDARSGKSGKFGCFFHFNDASSMSS